MHWANEQMVPLKNLRSVPVPMLRRSAIVLLSLCTLVMGSSWVWAQSERGDPQNGQMVYQEHCLRCHGEALDGKGPEAQYLILPPANLRSTESRAKTDWELLVPIYHGVMFTPMHGWRGRLTYEQIRDVLSYIRMMAPFDAIG